MQRPCLQGLCRSKKPINRQFTNRIAMQSKKTVFGREIDTSPKPIILELLVGLLFLGVGAFTLPHWWAIRTSAGNPNIYRTKALVLGDSTKSREYYYLLDFVYEGTRHQVYDSQGQSSTYIYLQGDSVDVFLYKSLGVDSVRISNFPNEYVHPGLFFLLGTLFPFGEIILLGRSLFRGLKKLRAGGG